MQQKIIFTFAFFLSVTFSIAQNSSVTISGMVEDKDSKEVLPYVNVILKSSEDSTLVSGTVTDEEGIFMIKDVETGKYLLEVSFLGLNKKTVQVQVGRLAEFLDMGVIQMEQAVNVLDEVVVAGVQQNVAGNLDKKTFVIEENISQAGGSVLQVMQNLPGIVVDQEGKVQLRGSERVMILLDGKQTALTGFGNQSGLDNIPASAIEKVEIINNPSARYDAQGMAGIINIVMKKEEETGLNGKVGLIAGIGALGEKRQNFPDVSDQYLWNPSINPSLSLNYRTEKLNYFFQGDALSFKRLNKNEFIQRTYEDGQVIQQQYLENRTQSSFTVRTGVDWLIDDQNTFTISALYGREFHIDRGELPYFDVTTGERQRFWKFWEEELNTSINASATWVHMYKQPGRKLQVGLNYAFQREDEIFYFNNTTPSAIGTDTTALVADEHVTDFTLDYIRPLRHGRIETGTKFRWRNIPNEMVFYPGTNSILDLDADGWAKYDELIGAIYGNYIYERDNWEIEAGLRVEYARLDYEVIPNHRTYESDGYDYFQPFPNMRFSYALNEKNQFSLFFNRRVDRPDESDVRIFPKYDDPEILKTGNPTLRPQFTQSTELGYRTNWKSGYLYGAVYARYTTDIITRVITLNPDNNLLNAISQNTGNGTNAGIEAVLEQEFNEWYTLNVNANFYHNTISDFYVENLYPFNTPFSMERQATYSGNVKVNNNFKSQNGLTFQLTGIYLAPDIIPQGKIDARFSIDFGLTKSVQKGRGELFLNGSDIFNTLIIRLETRGEGFVMTSSDYFQTQVFRLGYNYRF
jgi:outer membrane receptor protein involved in Fe transport